MKTIAVYANTCATGSYKELWPKAFYDGLQYHKDWQSTYVLKKELVDTEYAWCFAYQVKGDVKLSDQSHRRQIIDKYEPTGKIFFLDSDVLISYDGFELNKSHSLSEIAKKTGISKKGIQKIYNKGIVSSF